jgi:hypothetical protein
MALHVVLCKAMQKIRGYPMGHAAMGDCPRPRRGDGSEQTEPVATEPT